MTHSPTPTGDPRPQGFLGDPVARIVDTFLAGASIDQLAELHFIPVLYVEGIIRLAARHAYTVQQLAEQGDDS